MTQLEARSGYLRKGILSAAVLAALVVGCSKEEKGAEQKQASSSASDTKVSLQKTIATMVPEQAVGFFVWEGKHPAYDKLNKSAWGSSESDITKMLQDSNPQMAEVREVLQGIGLDLNNKDTWRNVFSQAALFIAPAAEAGKQGAVGLVFQSDPSVKIGEKLAALKTQLAKKEMEVQDLKLTGGTGFSLLDKSDGAGEKVFLGWKDNTGVFGSSDWVVDSVLTSKGDKLPAIVSSPNFSRAAQGLPDDSVRFATAYVDFQRATEVADRLGQAGAESVQKIKAADLPLKAISIGMAMDKSPETSLRLIYDPASKTKGWLGALSSSSSGELLSVVPGKPLVFLSLDGKTLRQVKELALAGMGEAGKAYGSQLSFLNDVNRVGISARANAAGQSLLPIPDMLIVAESANPAQTAQQLQTVVGAAMSSSGLPAMPWQDKQVNGVTVKSMMTPLGVGVFVASTKNLVLVASSEGQIQSALGGGTFVKGMPSQVEQVFAKEQSLGNLYVNFEEIAGMMENMGGMLSMYAPPDANGQNQFMQPENIQAMKKMGTVVGSVTLEEDAIGIKSFYQAPQPAA